MKTTYSMGVIDWSSDVCSSDLGVVVVAAGVGGAVLGVGGEEQPEHRGGGGGELSLAGQHLGVAQSGRRGAGEARLQQRSEGREQRPQIVVALRSEEHTSELQSLMRISYAVFCLKKKNTVEQTRKR